jgi:hypothetical protein
MDRLPGHRPGHLFRLELGLVVALVLTIGMGVARLHRGIILWVGLLFFTYATVAVLVFGDMWTVRHMGVLANGALAAGSWVTIVVGKPFSLDYARAHTDPALWNEPSFIRTNVIITATWAVTFTVNATLAWGKMEQFALPALGTKFCPTCSCLERRRSAVGTRTMSGA